MGNLKPTIKSILSIAVLLGLSTSVIASEKSSTTQALQEAKIAEMKEAKKVLQRTAGELENFSNIMSAAEKSKGKYVVYLDNARLVNDGAVPALQVSIGAKVLNLIFPNTLKSFAKGKATAPVLIGSSAATFVAAIYVSSELNERIVIAEADYQNAKRKYSIALQQYQADIAVYNEMAKDAGVKASAFFYEGIPSK